MAISSPNCQRSYHCGHHPLRNNNHNCAFRFRFSASQSLRTLIFYTRLNRLSTPPQKSSRTSFKIQSAPLRPGSESVCVKPIINRDLRNHVLLFSPLLKPRKNFPKVFFFLGGITPKSQHFPLLKPPGNPLTLALLTKSFLNQVSFLDLFLGFFGLNSPQATKSKVFAINIHDVLQNSPTIFVLGNPCLPVPRIFPFGP